MKKIIFILFCYFFSVNTSKPSDYLYDLGASTCISSGTGGKVKGVFGKQLPSLIPADLSMVLFTLGPCSLDLPHIHPRASEFIYLINGTLRTSFIADNGKVITNDLTPGQVTLIPQGLIHDQQNLGCTDAVFISALSNSDPGLQYVNDLFKLPNEALVIDLNKSIEHINAIKKGLPINIAPGTKDCLNFCKKANNKYN